MRVLKSRIISPRRYIEGMRSRTLFILTILVLSTITITASVFTGKPPNESEGLPKIQGTTLELTQIWINYYNATEQYQYGAQIRITNTRTSTMTLSNLQVVFMGEGRNRLWNGICPTKDLTLESGESKVISVESSEVQVSHLGYVGVAMPHEYLKLVLRQTNLGIRVDLMGTDASSNQTTQFESEATGLPTGNASAEDFAYTHDLTHLGLDPQFLDRWVETFNYLPSQDLFRFQPLQRGVIGTAQFPLITVSGNFLSSYYSVSQSVVDARTITVSTVKGPKVYYLFSRGYSFDDYLKDESLGKDGDTVYFYGDVFNYLAQTGTHYSVMFPTEVSSVEIRDPIDVAKGVIVSRVGEDYFNKYFSDPVASYDEWAGNLTHYVSFTYHISVGNYSTSQPIYLYFDSNWRLTSGSEYIPVEGNLQPFNVTLEQAKEIAVKAGIPSEPYGLEANLFSFGLIPGQPTKYQGKYNWSVVTWIDPPGANPRRNMYAVIDPITGKLYAIEQGGVGYIGMNIGTG